MCAVLCSGLPAGSIEFEFTGSRPGEKLYEELYFNDEMTIPTDHYKVRAARPRHYDDSSLHQKIDSLIKDAILNPDEVRESLSLIVPSYTSDQIAPKTSQLV